MKKYLIPFFLVLGNAYGDCSIHFYKNTIFTGNKKDLKSSRVIKKPDCNIETKEKFHQIVINSSGTLKSKYL